MEKVRIYVEQITEGQVLLTDAQLAQFEQYYDMLIEKTLLHLDLEEINQLFLIYPFKKIKQVWLDYLVPQAEYLYTLNRFFAWYYFKAKKPDAYIKSMATRHLNKMFA